MEDKKTEEYTQDYIDDYEKFMTTFKRTEVSGEQIGEMVMKMAGYFARYNIRLCDAHRKYMIVKADFQNQSDPVTGKPTSTAKAETLASATSEATTYELSKVHVQNLQEYINALKSLQKGTLFEYAQSA